MIYWHNETGEGSSQYIQPQWLQQMIFFSEQDKHNSYIDTNLALGQSLHTCISLHNALHIYWHSFVFTVRVGNTFKVAKVCIMAFGRS